MSTADDLAAIIESTRGAAWLEHAACADLDLERLDLFFVEAGRSLSPAAADMCNGCPVRRDCLDHATQRSIEAGYFGGVSPVGRRSRAVNSGSTG